MKARPPTSRRARRAGRGARGRERRSRRCSTGRRCTRSGRAASALPSGRPRRSGAVGAPPRALRTVAAPRGRPRRSSRRRRTARRSRSIISRSGRKVAPSPYETQRPMSTVASSRTSRASSRARRLLPIPASPKPVKTMQRRSSRAVANARRSSSSSASRSMSGRSRRRAIPGAPGITTSSTNAARSPRVSCRPRIASRTRPNVCAATRTSPAPAACSSCRASVTGAPATPSPAKTSPVEMPILSSGRTACRSAAARTARSASSSWICGAPNTAMAASPAKRSVMPPCRSTAMRRAVSSTASVSGSRSPPGRPANSTVTVRRDGCALAGRGGVERRVVAQDRLLQLAERRPRLEAELLVEHAPRFPVRLERLGLPAAAVEREHELPAQALVEGVLLDERLELGNEVDVPAEVELGVDQVLRRRQPQLLETGDLDGRERLVDEIGERRAAPEREPFTELLGALLDGARGPRLVGQPLEAARRRPARERRPAGIRPRG